MSARDDRGVSSGLKGNYPILTAIILPLSQWSDLEFFGHFYTNYQSGRDYDRQNHEQAWQAVKKVILDSSSAATDSIKLTTMDYFETLYRLTYENREKRGRAKAGYDIMTTRVFTKNDIPWGNQVAPGVVVTGSHAFADFGDITPDGKAILEEVLQDHAIFWVDCEEKSRKNKPRLVQQVKSPSREPLTSREPLISNDRYAVHSLGESRFLAHPADGLAFVDTEKYSEQWEEKVTAQLQSAIELCVVILKEKRKNPAMVVCFQCAEGKDRSLHMAILYSLVEKMANQPGFKLDLPSLVGHAFECRSRNALTSSAEHLPKLLLAFASDPKRVDSVYASPTFFRHELDPIFEPGVLALDGFIRQQLASVELHHSEAHLGGGSKEHQPEPGAAATAVVGSDSSPPSAQPEAGQQDSAASTPSSAAPHPKSGKPSRINSLDCTAFLLTLFFSPVCLPIILVNLCRYNSTKKSGSPDAHIGDLLFFVGLGGHGSAAVDADDSAQRQP